MRKKISSKRFLKFTENISKLSEIEFLGLVKMMNIKIYKENNEPKNFEEMLSDVLDNFLIIKEKPRKEIEKIIAISTKQKEIDNLNESST